MGQLEHNVKFERNVEKFEYFVDDKKHNYIPDFKIENVYIEIKGYDSDVWQNKLEQFPHKLDILYENEMEPIFKYVHSKYGKNFVKLYDGNSTISI